MSAADLSDTKRRLLDELLRGSGTAEARAAEHVTRRDQQEQPRLSAEQSHVWLHASMAPNLPLYNEPITIHRHGSFDLEIMKRSLQEVLRRHEIWRTSFQRSGGEVRQLVHSQLEIELPLIDLTTLPPERREAEALRLATADARRPFDLAEAPLFRARILKMDAAEHRLHLTLHHIIFDGVAIYRVILPELSAIYAAYESGRAPDLAEPALQYADYTLWRERRLAGPEMARQIAFWRDKLAGELPVLQLPCDHPRPALVSYRGSMEVFELTRSLTEALKELARREGATLYMLLLAAFKTLLFRYTGQSDIPVGGVTDTRRRPELERLVGYFLNTFVLRSQLDGDSSFRGYLAAVRRTVVEALDHSEVPFDWVVRELRPKRDPSAHPFFQILFSMEPPAPAFAPGWDLTQMEVTVGTAKFDLYLELDEREDHVIGRFLYSTALFEADTIKRMIGHWTRLLEGIVADPDASLFRLPMLTAPEATVLLLDWNRTEAPYPELCLDRWVAAQARATPDAIAVRDAAGAWSYRTLDARAEEIAASLRAAGAGPETLVGIALSRSREMVAALLAVHKAGAAYLPLDPGFPALRLELILEDAQPALLLTEPDIAPHLPASNARLLICADCRGAPGEAAAAAVENQPDRLAYVLYTSGSTGRPKGVEITHRALVNFLAAMQREPGFTARDSLVAVTTISFDIAGLELFLPLVSGGTLVLAGRDVATDPQRLAELVRESGCSMLQATPATWRGLLEAGWPGAAHLKLLCGGEALPRELADRLLGCGAALWNMYGPTETTIWSCLHKVEAGSESIPVGRPIANTTVYILDARGQPVPAGVAGDLHIGGAGVARGYRNRPDLTAERFVALPVAPGERLYRTGDIARYRADGAIEWLGRSDNQVKIRGFRIELEDIEAALLAHPAIAAAAVRIWPDAAGLPSLAAYTVARPGAEIEPAELRAFLQQRLPDYMVPARQMALTALPMTPNGKIDRNALPKPEASQAVIERVAPVGEREERLAAVWREVLQLDWVGAEDDFFTLGGHSLLATTLLRRVEEEFGVLLPIAAVFRSPTVRRMAGLIGDSAGSVSASRAAAPAAPAAKHGMFASLWRSVQGGAE